MMYTILLKPAAEREREKLPSNIRVRIDQDLLGLETNPRPPGVSKLADGNNRWRIRVGDYRVIYAIEDDMRLVIVLRIAPRREIYRD